MNPIALLSVIALAQGVFLVFTVAMLLINRTRQSLRGGGRRRAESIVSAPVKQWLIGQGDARDVAAALRGVPADFALEQLVSVLASRVSSEEHDELATALREEEWVRDVVRQARSRVWWRRLRAARLLAVVGVARDRELLRLLLADSNPAVQTAATSALRRLANDALINFILEQLPDRAIAVRRYQFAELKECWRLTTPSLLRRVTRGAAPLSLEVWINLAESIGSAELLERVVTLHDHENALVRIAVAKALKRYYHPDSVTALIVLLRDRDWRVRGQAARALGAIGASEAVVALGSALCDSSWWVRFRSGLALAQLGEAGRRVLRDARATGDHFAADMATMISGLSEGGIVELAEG